MLKYFRGLWPPMIIKHMKCTCILYTNIRVFNFHTSPAHENNLTTNISQSTAVLTSILGHALTIFHLPIVVVGKCLNSKQSVKNCKVERYSGPTYKSSVRNLQMIQKCNKKLCTVLPHVKSFIPEKFLLP